MSLSVQVHRIVKERKERGEYIPLHTHPFFHCVYIISGRGRVQIGSRVIDARRGLFLRIAPHVEHAIFGEDAMQSFDIKFSAAGAFLEPLNALPLALPLDAYEHSLVMSIFHLAVRDEAYAEALINTRMTELLLLLLRREARESVSHPMLPGGSGASLYPALTYIEQHPEQMPPVSFLAGLCGYTPSYFSTAFKQALGCSPARYLHRKKVELARERMLTTDCTVGELAAQAGMDAASFSRMFKRETGISPSQYLRRANSDVGINISPHSPYLPDGDFEIPKQC
nr:AraC family transcriptional regulator [uncultured Oscillibacter sp.]